MAAGLHSGVVYVDSPEGQRQGLSLYELLKNKINIFNKSSSLTIHLNNFFYIVVRKIYRGG